MNAVDIDFSTPIIYALRNLKMPIVKVLLKNERTCLRQASMKYGTPLHLALHNKDFKNAIKILKKLRKSESFSGLLDLNKLDEDGNNPFHVLMRIFNDDVESSRKLAYALL